MTTRFCAFVSNCSTSRIDAPVYFMKTSSSVGRFTLTERIRTSRSANSRGTNASPASTPKVTAPSEMTASMPNCSASRVIARSSSSVWMRTVSCPTESFRAAGVSMATISPWSMIAIRSQNSASSM